MLNVCPKPWIIYSIWHYLYGAVVTPDDQYNSIYALHVLCVCVCVLWIELLFEVVELQHMLVVIHTHVHEVVMPGTMPRFGGSTFVVLNRCSILFTNHYETGEVVSTSFILY